MNFFVLFIVILSAFCSHYLTRLLIPLLRIRTLDIPNDRSSHITPTPSGGGTVFVFLYLLASIIHLYFLEYDSSSLFTQCLLFPVLALPLAIVGFIDDRFSLPSYCRFIVQICTSLLIIYHSQLSAQAAPLVFFFLVISVVGIINFTNFMDGLDGLVAGCMTVAISAAAIELSPPSTVYVLLGSLLGFLSFNWSPAKIFMGDVGSTFLGAFFSHLVLLSSSWTQAFSILLLSTPLLSDAVICIFRRLRAGQPIFKAHSLHLFQRLYQAGLSHSMVSFIYILASLLLAIALVFGDISHLLICVLIELLAGYFLDKYVAVPFALSSDS